MSGRNEKALAKLPASLKNAVKGTNTSLPKAVKAARRKPTK